MNHYDTFPPYHNRFLSVMECLMECSLGSHQSHSRIDLPLPTLSLLALYPKPQSTSANPHTSFPRHPVHRCKQSWYRFRVASPPLIVIVESIPSPYNTYFRSKLACPKFSAENHPITNSWLQTSSPVPLEWRSDSLAPDFRWKLSDHHSWSMQKPAPPYPCSVEMALRLLLLPPRYWRWRAVS